MFARRWVSSCYNDVVSIVQHLAPSSTYHDQTVLCIEMSIAHLAHVGFLKVVQELCMVLKNILTAPADGAMIFVLTMFGKVVPCWGVIVAISVGTGPVAVGVSAVLRACCAAVEPTIASRTVTEMVSGLREITHRLGLTKTWFVSKTSCGESLCFLLYSDLTVNSAKPRPVSCSIRKTN